MGRSGAGGVQAGEGAKYILIEEVAKRLGVAVSTVRGLIAVRQLPPARAVGLNWRRKWFSAKTVEALRQRREHRPKAAPGCVSLYRAAATVGVSYWWLRGCILRGVAVGSRSADGIWNIRCEEVERLRSLPAVQARVRKEAEAKTPS